MKVIKELNKQIKIMKRRYHIDGPLAFALHQGFSYAISRQEQLETRAFLLMPKGHTLWIRGGGLDEGPHFNSVFGQLVAVNATANGALAAAIIAETWYCDRRLAPGERPSQQDDRREGVIVCAQARGSLIGLMFPIQADTLLPSVRLPSNYPHGWGRFIREHEPSPLERTAAKAFLDKGMVKSGDAHSRFEGWAASLAELAAFNPEAQPPQW